MRLLKIGPLRRRGGTILPGLVLLIGLLAGCSNDNGLVATPAATPTLAAAVSPATGARLGGNASGTPAATVVALAGYQLRVTQNGQLLKALTAADINALPQQTLDLGGRPMIGTPLKNVLALAEVTTAQRVTVTGTNATRSGPASVTLLWAVLTDKVLLGINQRGAGKLFGPDLAGDQWVVDVTEIAVTP